MGDGIGVAVCGNPTAGLGIGFRWENWETLGPLFERERHLTHTLNFNFFVQWLSFIQSNPCRIDMKLDP